METLLRIVQWRSLDNSQVSNFQVSYTFVTFNKNALFSSFVECILFQISHTFVTFNKNALFSSFVECILFQISHPFATFNKNALFSRFVECILLTALFY